LEKISLKAPAKINLYLRVMSKREDGYHNIESLMQAVDIYDEITLEKSDTIELICNDPSLPVDESNLAIKAATKLQNRLYFPGVKIHLIKNIPSGAGLGGGSSDAAFVLRGLLKLYNLNLSMSELFEIGVSVGSDVPFFLSRGQAIVRGKGEIVEPVVLPLTYSIVVAYPPFSISTPEMFSMVKLNLTNEEIYSLLPKKIDVSRLMRSCSEFRNDLEQIAISKYPDLSDLKRSLLGTGAFFVSMTGSGSSLFGLFPGGTGFAGKFDLLKERGCKIFICRPVVLPPPL